MHAPIDKSCRFSYDDLFRAATGRDMTAYEARRFASLQQPEKNDAVKSLVLQTHGVFACEDRIGADGVTYTAFWAAGTLVTCSPL